jgi:hypothetical protein
MDQPLPTVARLHELFDLRPSGELVRRVSLGNTAAGRVAGAKRSDGYVRLKVDGTHILAHRIAFAMANGEWPVGMIDRINGVRSDNRPSNLRLATRQQNGQNRRLAKNSSTGLKGAQVHGDKFAGRISVDGKRIFLGTFDTPEQAHAAYVAAADRRFGVFARAA